jgi:hypothetical protein
MTIDLNSSSRITGASQFSFLNALRNIDLKSFVRNMDWKVAAGFALSAVGILGLALFYLRSEKKVLSPQPEQKPLTETTEPSLKPFAKITPEDLFDTNQLNEPITLMGDKITLKYICEIVLTILKRYDGKQISINRRDGDALLRWLWVGMPESASIMGPHQKESWVIRILMAMRDKGYVSEFEVKDISEIEIQLK